MNCLTALRGTSIPVSVVCSTPAPAKYAALVLLRHVPCLAVRGETSRSTKGRLHTLVQAAFSFVGMHAVARSISSTTLRRSEPAGDDIRPGSLGGCRASRARAGSHGG